MPFYMFWKPWIHTILYRKHKAKLLLTVSLFIVLLGKRFHISAEESCTNGLEFECKTVQGNGTTCVLGCNSTITNLILSGSCLDNCCKVCHSNCHKCVYTKIVTFCIDNKNASWTKDVIDKQPRQFRIFEKNLQKSLHILIPQHNQTYFKTEILSVQWCSIKSDNAIQVYTKIMTNNRKKLTIVINNIRNSTISGKLDGLTLLPDVFEVMSENLYAELTNQKGSREEHLDVVELIVTCVAALIVMLAIVWCLFYLCTTPTERERCNPCKRNSNTNT